MQPQLKALLISDLVESTHTIEKLGMANAARFSSQHDRITRDLIQNHHGQEIDKSDGFLIVFERPIQAVFFALNYHRQLQELSDQYQVRLHARIGIHFDEIIIRQNPARDVERGAKPLEIEGVAKSITARIMSLALPGQTLLSRAAFELARKSKTESEGQIGELFWEGHGPYILRGVDEPMDIFEVGMDGVEPRTPPTNPRAGRKVLSDDTRGNWSPVAGINVPQRRQWVLMERLERGFFGEVWLAKHEKTGEKRVFKFCFDADTLRALKREVTLFRLLKDSLPDSGHVVRILEWSFDEEPFFLEMEYLEGGNLLNWIEFQGGIQSVSFEDRLEIVSQVSEALAAAHSVGVLHKDIKPANILLTAKKGSPQVKLGDFGIGRIFDSEQLKNFNITAFGMTEVHLDASKASYSGTRLYMAPEIIEGRVATVQSDIYAVGVLLYQLLVGDLSRSLALGWERDIREDLLREDITWMVEGSPQRRLGNALRIAERLRSLEIRTEERALQIQEEQQAEANRRSLTRAKRFGLISLTALVALIVFSSLLFREVKRANKESQRAHREAEVSKEVTEFLQNLFQVSEPGVEKGGSITAKEILDKGAQQIRIDLKNQPQTQSRLMGIIGSVYQQLGLYDSAKTQLEDAAALALKSLGPEDNTTIEAYFKLVRLDIQTGDFVDAQRILNLKFIHSAIDNIPEFHIEALALKGTIFTRKGNYTDAITNLKESISLQKKAQSIHPLICETLTSLAEVYWLQARHDLAEPLLAEVLELRIRDVGELHVKTASALNNLAAVYRELGKYEKAIPLYQRALHIYDEVLEPDHPDFASVLNNLATVYDDLGEYDKAEPLFKRALNIRLKALGPLHPSLATSMNNLAYHYFRTGALDQSLELHRKALAIRKTSLGPDHRDVALSLQNIGRILLMKGEVNQAQPLLEESLRIRKNALGENHPDYAESLKEMGHCLLIKKEYNSSIEYLEKALAIFESSQQKRASREWNETSGYLEKAYQETNKTTLLEQLKEKINTRNSKIEDSTP